MIFLITATASYDLFIKIWSVDDDYTNVTTLTGHEHSVSSVRFLPGDNHLLSSSRDHTVRVWDLVSKSVLVGRVFIQPVLTMLQTLCQGLAWAQ